MEAYGTAREMYDAWKRANPESSDSYESWKAGMLASFENLALALGNHSRRHYHCPPLVGARSEGIADLSTRDYYSEG